LESVTEAELRDEVIRLAHKNGHLVFCCTDSRKNLGDHGFPDLVILAKDRVLFAELKSGGGERSPAQVTWHYRLIVAGQISALWRPKDLPQIEAALREL
jgi:hypothetical protein